MDAVGDVEGSVVVRITRVHTLRDDRLRKQEVKSGDRVAYVEPAVRIAIAAQKRHRAVGAWSGLGGELK